MSKKPYLGPIIRDMGYSKDDGAYTSCRDDDHLLYYVFLYKDRKPVYKLTCVFKDVLEQSIKDFLESDDTLKQLFPIQARNILQYRIEYEDVQIDCLEKL